MRSPDVSGPPETGTSVEVERRSDRSSTQRGRAGPWLLVGAGVVLAGLALVAVLAPRGSDRSDADERRRAAASVERATAAIDAHVALTGIADPERTLAEADARLTALQASRDRAVAARSESASTLEEQVAVAQERTFDLRAVASRRAVLVAAQRRAARTLGAESADASTSSSNGLSPGRIALAAVLLGLAAAFLAAGAVALARTRTRRHLFPAPVAPGETHDETGASPPMELAEIQRRLDLLAEHSAETPVEAGAEGPRADQRR